MTPILLGMVILLAAGLVIVRAIRVKRSDTRTLEDPYRGVSDPSADISVDHDPVALLSRRIADEEMREYIRRRMRYQPPEVWPHWYAAEIEARKQQEGMQ